MTIYHKHHIIPKHMGGTDDPSNLVELTVEEHAQAHKKLWEEHGRWEDKLAWQGLSKMIGKEEIISEVIKNTHTGKIISEETKKKMSDASPWKGKERSETTRKKISEKLKGRTFDEDWIEKLRLASTGENNPMYGKTHNEEARKKISEARKRCAGKKRGPYKGKTEYSTSHKKVLKRDGKSNCK